MIYKNIFLTSLMVLFVGFMTQVQAQDRSTDHDYEGKGKISGQVMDTSTNEPLSGIEVTLDMDNGDLEDALGAAEGHTATTDENGEFNFEGVEPGNYTVRVAQDGYQEREQPVNIESDETEEIELQLLPSDDDDGGFWN